MFCNIIYNCSIEFMPTDFLFISHWWFVIFILGIIFLPLTFTLFNNLFDKGYIFSKVLGMVMVSYGTLILSLSHILPFTTPQIVFIILICIGFNFFFFRKNSIEIIKNNWKIFLFEEVLFLVGLISWSFVRSHTPDIHGLEKFMDFGFLNSILRTDYFPPKDIWFTPYPINYYYFGHLITAVLTKISSIPSNISYNLMIATLFSFTFVCSFSIGLNLIYFYLKSLFLDKRILLPQKTIIIFSGLLTAFLVSLSGNLQTVYSFFSNYSTENVLPFWRLPFSPQTFPNNYWYPNATRFIYNTIHEFPLYSFVVSDLHGHVLDIPIVLLTIALLLSIFVNPKILKSNSLHFIGKLILISFLLAIMYMTNVWDGVIYLLLCVFILIGLLVKSLNSSKEISFYGFFKYLIILIVEFFIFALPFNLTFKPFASGIGIICPPQFLTDLGKIGPFLFEIGHCQKSPWWQILILHGFFYFFVVSFLIIMIRKIKIKNSYIGFRKISPSDGFVLILVILSTILIIIPEFAYLKDIYPAHYRANTMFKLTYQEFIMLSIFSSYLIIRLVLNLRNNVRNNKFFIIYYFITIILLTLVFIYPTFSIGSYYNNLQVNHGLDGTKYLATLYPGDYKAIQWINKKIKGQEVILEAQGDSYTDFARISSNTGLPTVLGWTVHEWLWRGTYEIPAPRISEVQTLYETQDIDVIKQLINKYKITYIYIGSLEKQKYPALSEEKFRKIGKLIYHNNEVRIYKII